MTSAVDAIASHITQTTGLSLSAAQRADLARYVESRFRALGVTTASAFIARLSAPSEFRLLIDSLTVKETYFNRSEAQFDALRDHLLADFRERAAAAGRPVRIWSAGCCTGEEAYTLALIAAEAGCGDRIEILATDINETYLETALTGAYAPRALRKLPAPLVERYFIADGARFVIREDLQRRVAFKFLNLAEPIYPSFLNGTTGLDMIFCRNVLIYFDKEHVDAILARFAECLLPHGVLALGHAEILPSGARMRVTRVGEAFFYTDGPGRTSGAGNALSVPDAGSPVVHLRQRAPGARARQWPASPTRAPGHPEPAAPAGMETALTLADEGRFDEATAVCREILQRNPGSAQAHYVLGLVSLRQPGVAHEHFRRTVYLDPAHLLARYHLAHCAEQTGHPADARREYANVENLARSHMPDEVLDMREGVTYGMLAMMGRRGMDRVDRPVVASGQARR